MSDKCIVQNGKTKYSVYTAEAIEKVINELFKNLIDDESISSESVYSSLKIDSTFVKDVGDSNWQTPSFQNGWVNYQTDGEYHEAKFRKDAEGYVHIRGLVKSGSVGSTYAIFTLPTGYRPMGRLIFAVQSNGLGRCDVKDNGEVIAYSGSNSWFSISGIVFKAEQ
jgi:hypothetical protein